MLEHHTFEKGVKFRPDYKWHEEGAERDCPRCDQSLELVEDSDSYYGKPWWCPPCQWQFSEEDLDGMTDAKEE